MSSPKKECSLTAIFAPALRLDASAQPIEKVDELSVPQVILSFDVEEHYRIEAASALSIDNQLRTHYDTRLEPSTRWLLDELERAEVRATFFVVGDIARNKPALVRAIHQAGHEIASHGWDHRRVLSMTPKVFRRDVQQSKDALEQVTGEPVLGYRAPTFSIIRETAWALDVLADLGMKYDSSIYPVRHDRYGVPRAPRGPFWASGFDRTILELPPATLRLFGVNAPMGGGGYFRLFPLWLTRWAVRQTRSLSPALAMLYFHPWEFDPAQLRLPLGAVNRFRTYVGIKRSKARLVSLMKRYRFVRALDAARALCDRGDQLPHFNLKQVQGNLDPECVEVRKLLPA